MGTANGKIILLCLLLLPAHYVHAQKSQCNNPKGNVARAVVTTAVQDREPVDRVLILENDIPRVYFFSDLRQMQGETVTHRWEHEGKVVLEKDFNVKGPRWRVFSFKDLSPDMTGNWTIVITDSNGCPVKAVIFQYVEKGQDGSAILDLKN